MLAMGPEEHVLPSFPKIESEGMAPPLLSSATNTITSNESLEARSDSQAAPTFGFLSPALHVPIGYFSPNWPLAYLIATVLLTTGLFIGHLIPKSQPEQLARKSLPTQDQSLPESEMKSVGQVTGMVACVWEGTGGRVQGSETANPKSEIRNHKSAIRLGDRLALRSGLLEITYDTGAKVILQGPVAYEVDSSAGGYISVGKLTARLEQRSEVRGQKSEIRNQTFAVRTPTALVTDLGTEFGVDVAETGSTTTQVFRGSVRLEATSADGTPYGPAEVLHENESARIADRESGAATRRITMLNASAKPLPFVREIPQRVGRVARMLDLADVVAGGDGFSGRRNRGIDPRNGRTTGALPPANDPFFIFPGDRRYHRVEKLPFVDGVFIPDGRTGGVQIDSEGRMFDGFPDTTCTTAGYLWAGGTIPTSPGNPGGIPTVLKGVDYASPGHDLLFLHANKGITFDLVAIRHANPGCKLTRFLAMAGNTETQHTTGGWVYADLWVLVDGHERFVRRQINHSRGAFAISVPLNGNERFLTLAATDGGDGIAVDWIVFGDPRLEIVTVESQQKSR
jgi:hypothetical protein